MRFCLPIITAAAAASLVHIKGLLGVPLVLEAAQAADDEEDGQNDEEEP